MQVYNTGVLQTDISGYQVIYQVCLSNRRQKSQGYYDCFLVLVLRQNPGHLFLTLKTP